MWYYAMSDYALLRKRLFSLYFSPVLALRVRCDLQIKMVTLRPLHSKCHLYLYQFELRCFYLGFLFWDYMFDPTSIGKSFDRVDIFQSRRRLGKPNE
jgi:hypothetical protein